MFYVFKNQNTQILHEWPKRSWAKPSNY